MTAMKSSGWFADSIGQTQIAWHTGNVPDSSAYIALLPELQRGIVLLANAGHHMMVPVCGELGAGLAALLAGEQPARRQPAMTRIVPWCGSFAAIWGGLRSGLVLCTLRAPRRAEREMGGAANYEKKHA